MSDTEINALFSESNSGLPVTFGAVKASVTNNNLIIKWETLQETNSSHFEIEVSKNGNSFKKVGIVNSKASNGYSALPIQYSFNLDLSDFKLLSLVFIPFLLGLSSIGLKRKNKLLLPFLLIGVITIGLISCSKDASSRIRPEKNTLFIRIKQVDFDNKSEYSPVLRVTYLKTSLS